MPPKEETRLARPVECEPFVFRPSGFYTAQCAVRLRADQLARLFPMKRTEPTDEKAEASRVQSGTNMDNGNRFETRVIEVLGISDRTCSLCCELSAESSPLCPGMLALRRAINEAYQYLEGSQNSGNASDGRWHEALAQVHITPPNALQQKLGSHVHLSKSFADLVFVGTRNGRVVVEVADVKYSPEAQPYHKRQVACYIVYLRHGPLAPLLEDVEWQGGIWLPREHTGRVPVNTSTATASTPAAPTFTFDTIDAGVLRQPISDLADYVAEVENFFSRTLPTAVGDGWPFFSASDAQQTHAEALATSWTDIEDLSWTYDASLCAFCPHQSTCARQHAAEVHKRRRITRDGLLPFRADAVSPLLPEKVMRCELQTDSRCHMQNVSLQLPLVWNKFFTLAVCGGEEEMKALRLLGLATASMKSLREWLRTVEVHISVPPGEKPQCDDTSPFRLDTETEQTRLETVLTTYAKGGWQCLVLDTPTQDLLQLILYLLAARDGEVATWKSYWLESPEMPALPLDAFERKDTSRYFGAPPVISQHVYTASDLVHAFTDLPWHGAPLTAETLHALCVPVQDDWEFPSVEAASVCLDLRRVADNLLEGVNCARRAAMGTGAVQWLPRPPTGKTMKLNESRSLMTPVRSVPGLLSDDEWRSLVTMLVTFSARSQETALHREALASVFVLRPETHDGVTAWRPVPPPTAASFCETLRALMMFAERVQTGVKVDADIYKFQAMQSWQPLWVRPFKAKDEPNHPCKELQLTVPRAALKAYLSALDACAPGEQAPEFPIMTRLCGALDSTLPIVLMPVVTDTAPCTCYPILLAFLAASLWKTPREPLVFAPYLNGTWSEQIVNVLATTSSNLLTSGEAHPSGQALTEEQRRAVENVYSARALTLLWGPPGTGKTATLAHMVVDMFHSHQGPLKVLVVANTNNALDVLHVKITSVYATVHQGQSAKPDFSTACLTKDGSGVAKGEDKRALVMCTVFGAYTKVWSEAIRNFDVLIVEEASMLSASSAILAGQLLNPKCHKLILAGDLLQLQPIQEDFGGNALLSVTYRTERHWMGSILQALFGPPESPSRQLGDLSRLYDLCESANGSGLPDHVVQLNTCFRSLSNIVALFARLYPNPLQCGRTEADKGRVEYVCTEKDGDEAEAVLRVLRTCDKGEKKIIVTPHRRQRLHIGAVLAAVQKSNPNDERFAKVEVETTERTQGTEAHCVILCYGRDVRIDTEFAYQLFRMNVAVSRAISRVVVILDAQKVELLQLLPDGVTPFTTTVRDGRSTSPGMSLRGWELLRHTFNSATALKV